MLTRDNRKRCLFWFRTRNVWSAVSGRYNLTDNGDSCQILLLIPIDKVFQRSWYRKLAVKTVCFKQKHWKCNIMCWFPDFEQMKSFFFLTDTVTAEQAFLIYDFFLIELKKTRSKHMIIKRKHYCLNKYSQIDKCLHKCDTNDIFDTPCLKIPYKDYEKPWHFLQKVLGNHNKEDKFIDFYFCYLFVVNMEKQHQICPVCTIGFENGRKKSDARYSFHFSDKDPYTLYFTSI